MVIAVHFRLENENGTPFGEGVHYVSKYGELVKREWDYKYENYKEHHYVPRDVWEQWIWWGVENIDIDKYQCHIYDILDVPIENNVDKGNYFIMDYSGGYFGIVENKSLKCVFGGDPANEDDYDFEFVKMVFDKWDGTLVDGEIPYSHIAF